MSLPGVAGGRAEAGDVVASVWNAAGAQTTARLWDGPLSVGSGGLPPARWSRSSKAPPPPRRAGTPREAGVG